jgi:hypothetical protein
MAATAAQSAVRFFPVGAPASVAASVETCRGGGLGVITTVASPAGAAFRPSSARQLATSCGRSRAATARPASMPASNPGAKPAGLSWANGS